MGEKFTFDDLPEHLREQINLLAAHRAIGRSFAPEDAPKEVKKAGYRAFIDAERERIMDDLPGNAEAIRGAGHFLKTHETFKERLRTGETTLPPGSVAWDMPDVLAYLGVSPTSRPKSRKKPPSQGDGGNEGPSR